MESYIYLSTDCVVVVFCAGSVAMSDMESVATLMESTSLKIQQLQRAFAELESQSAVTMNFKWKQLEDHFRGLEQSLKKKFDELKKQEEEFQETVARSEKMLEEKEAVWSQMISDKLQTVLNLPRFSQEIQCIVRDDDGVEPFF